MTLIDYLLSIGKTKGNTKHFKNLLNIHSEMMRLDRENRTAKRMINAKNDLLIHKEQKEIKLNSEISRLNIELSKLKDKLKEKNKQVEALSNDLESDFMVALNNWRLEEKTKDF